MLVIKNMTKKFGDRTIFNNVDCELKEGVSYAIIGKSGVGKTTFLNILGGLESPSSGEVLVDNVPVNEANLPKLRRDKFGFIFQNFGLIDDETVKENLEIGFANQKIPKEEQKRRILKALDELDLKGISLSQKVHTLSGGEQQRIALARIILKSPSIIFADEPTGSLDAGNSKLILNHLLTDFGPKATIFIATHDFRVWDKCDYIIKIKNKDILLVSNNIQMEK
ncbi:ABC transporter ATP-binding protein [Lactobacillus gallinarum]|uniref:ATP-binding cassette domain-containing protein n=1 Tax=Lactobacillus gallinarum TaxID=52242 RepID=UPI00248E8F55|nr:ABC transporter ATP-binding protein [Lactobacillus gallinarum]